MHDYEVYRSPHTGKQERRCELISLLYLDGAQPISMCFNGFLVIGNARHYVQAVTIRNISVEGYGDDQDPTVMIYIQSALAYKDKKFDIWYRLRKPAAGYLRFHRPFLWVAQLAKHIVDYMESQPVCSVGFENFREEFCYWVVSRFAQNGNAEFQTWHDAFNKQTDFRIAVNEHISYIHKQATSLSSWKQLSGHPIWGHCMARGLTSIEKQPEVVPKEDTLATPHVYNSFSKMYFSKKLKEVKLSEAVKIKQERRKRSLGFTGNFTMKGSTTANCQPYGTSVIKVGDVVAVESQETDRQKWRDSRREWLAYVQATELLDDNAQRLFVLWLYRPEDTNIFKAKYPIAKELFISDNCNCDDGELLSTAVKGKYSIDWNPKTLDTTKDFFVRQAYITQDSAYVTFNHNKHVQCMCRRKEVPAVKQYQKGDTVYITKTYKQRRFLEPVVIRQMHRASQKATVQVFLRLKRDCQGIPGGVRKTGIANNELVLSNKLIKLPISRILRRCHIRYLPKSEVLAQRIPFPYDRGGAGDYWFMSMELVTKSGCQLLEFLDGLPSHIVQSMDYIHPLSLDKLAGMSLFSGGGNLDRGIEEGGAVNFKAVVELLPSAVHTVRANTKDPSQLKIFLGSVDDYLKLAGAGAKIRLVAQVGEIAFISAGSPCPGKIVPSSAMLVNCHAPLICTLLVTGIYADTVLGFSALQRDMLSEKSLGNASRISTFCSYVDLYRPLYGMLENVVRMASTHKVLDKDQNVLSQLVACLVSMGYQVNQYIMDSWSYGSMQRRSRIILTIAAPGLQPILQPPHTHSKPYEDTAGTSLGMLPNGERFGHREYYPTPFEHVSAAEVLSDLPDIGNGSVQVCIPYPDHRLVRPSNPKDRGILERIPLSPPGCGYAAAHQLGLIPRALEIHKQETTRSYRRINKKGLIPTITTLVNIQDARNGDVVHWSQHRPLSILEAKRTQGYLDNEPIVGSPQDQWKTVGNGVDRKVSLAMGFALRRAIESDVKQTLDQNPLVDLTTEQLDNLADRNENEDEENEDEDVGSDFVSTLSCIDVCISPQKRVEILQSSQTAVFRGHQLPTQSLAASEHTEYNLAPELSSNGRLGEILNRSVIFEGPAGLNPLSSLSRPQSLPVCSKRGREDNTSEINKISVASCRQLGPRKRSRHSSNDSGAWVSLPDLPDSISVDGAKTALAGGSRSQTSLSHESSDQSRRTRNSGAMVEYEPRNWNVRPEKEFKCS